MAEWLSSHTLLQWPRVSPVQILGTDMAPLIKPCWGGIPHATARRTHNWKYTTMYRGALGRKRKNRIFKKKRKENNILVQCTNPWKGTRRYEEMAYFKIRFWHISQLKQELKIIQNPSAGILKRIKYLKAGLNKNAHYGGWPSGAVVKCARSASWRPGVHQFRSQVRTWHHLARHAVVGIPHIKSRGRWARMLAQGQASSAQKRRTDSS